MSSFDDRALRCLELVLLARERSASDVHLAPNVAAILRIDGGLVPVGNSVPTSAEIQAFIDTVLDARGKGELERTGATDSAYRSDRLGTVRVHVFRDRTGLRCAVRLLPATVPTLASLDIPAVVGELALRRSGLLLVVGPTGSGKTTLLAAMLESINRAGARHVVTFEDPIEYVHHAQASLVAQCEVGRDVVSLHEGIRGVLRADPDVIAIGELRDTAAIASALEAAETGHFVLASLHTNDSIGALERIVDAFSVAQRDQIRAQLAHALVAAIGIRLVRRCRGTGRRAAVEILVGTGAVRHLLREGKTHQLRSAIQTGRSAGMQTIEMHLSELVRRGEVSAADARAACDHPEDLTTEATA